MGIKYNGRDLGTPTRAQLQNGIRNLLLDGVKAEVAEVTRPRLKKLTSRVQRVALTEAHRMLTVVDEVISASARKALSPAMMMNSALRSKLSGMPQDIQSRAFGRVDWVPLTERYRRRKVRKFPKSTGFFSASGRMRGYFNRFGKSIIETRLGGIRVTVNDKISTKVDRGRVTFDMTSRVNPMKDLIGGIDVNMFPNMNTSLMPMLSANKWSTNLSWEADYHLFRGTAQRYKLTNPKGSYRPLFLPILQFFILVNLPTVIISEIEKYLKLEDIGGANL